MNWKDKLRNVIEDNSTKTGRSFDLFIQALIVLSLISFSIETLPEISIQTKQFLRYFEIFSITIFTVEYILRLFVSKKKLKFIFSFYGIIDLMAILPFYLTIGIDLRSIRVFRLFRLFRIFKMLRFSMQYQKLTKQHFMGIIPSTSRPLFLALQEKLLRATRVSLPLYIHYNAETYG